MTRNHLPGNADLEPFGRPAVRRDELRRRRVRPRVLGRRSTPPRTRCCDREGEYSWGGAASTIFWVDPREEIVVLFLTQLLPSSTYPIRSQLNQLVHQALVD